MVPNRKSLWYSLAFIAIGSLLIRLSFSLNAGATIVMILGIVWCIAALVVFLDQFQEMINGYYFG